MHLRVSTALGTPVISDQEEQILGTLSYPLIRPDTGKIEGFFVQTGSWPFSDEMFLSSLSIVSWGTAVHVRSSEYVSHPEDILRIRQVLDDPRRLLFQRIVTEQGRKYMGRLTDIQFETKTCMIEWLFPRKFFVMRSPIPANDIVLVTEKEIIVKDPILPLKEVKAEKKDLGFPEVLPTATLKAD